MNCNRNQGHSGNHGYGGVFWAPLETLEDCERALQAARARGRSEREVQQLLSEQVPFPAEVQEQAKQLLREWILARRDKSPTEAAARDAYLDFVSDWNRATT